MAAIEEYQRLLASFENARVVEIGIAYGGSVGFLALTARPTRLVAIELATTRSELLDALIADRDLEANVRLYYGTDQADVERLNEIVRVEFADQPLDLVIDDGSHLYDASVATFECLFPRLRAGGRYLIEDWGCDHAIRSLLSAALADP
ncbi:MAG: class I SAM-dependent methyltransferase, partial [Acidimicrobiales bacterium]